MSTETTKNTPILWEELKRKFMGHEHFPIDTELRVDKFLVDMTEKHYREAITAPLREEIARVAARVAAADVLRDVANSVMTNIISESKADSLYEAIYAYDATATATTAPDIARTDAPKTCDGCPADYCRMGGIRCEESVARTVAPDAASEDEPIHDPWAHLKASEKVVVPRFTLGLAVRDLPKGAVRGALRDAIGMSYTEAEPTPDAPRDHEDECELRERIDGYADTVAQDIDVLTTRTDANTEDLWKLAAAHRALNARLDEQATCLSDLRERMDGCVDTFAKETDRLNRRLEAQRAPVVALPEAVIQTAFREMAGTDSVMMRGDLMRALQAVLEAALRASGEGAE